MRRLLALALLLLALPAEAQVPEAQVETALAALVAAAHEGAPADLAPRLACISGVEGALAVRPCLLPGDALRVEAVGGFLRTAFPADARRTLDWLAARSAPYGPVTAVQIKVGPGEPPALQELTWVQQGPEVLLADAGPHALWTPEPPAYETAEDSVVAQFEGLMRVLDQPEAAAPYIGCPDRTAWTAAACDWSSPDDRTLVEGVARSLARLQASGPTAWGIEEYLTDAESEGTWHVLRVGYLAPGGGRRGLYVAFLLVDGQYRLGDIDPVEGP